MFSVENQCDGAFESTCAFSCARIAGVDTCICPSGYEVVDTTECDGK